MSFPIQKALIRSWAFILIPIMLGVKLDVNWCSDYLGEILVNQLSLHSKFHLILHTFNHACTSIKQ